MAIDLDRDDLQRLVQIAKNLPPLDVERDRRSFLIAALGESPRANTLATMIDLGGSPDVAAMKLITGLSRYGQLEYGKQALGVFLNAMVPYIDLEIGDEVAAMFSKYPLDTRVTPRRPVNDWRNKNNTKDETKLHERIVGENTQFPIHVLQRTLEVARAVALVRVQPQDDKPPWVGTGFLIDHDLIMTNHHVIKTIKQAVDSSFTFNYQVDVDGKPCPTFIIRPTTNGLFWSNPLLDISLVQVDVPPDFIPPMKLSTKLPTAADAMTLIGHPSGHLKQISLRNNAIQFVDERVLQYTASTEPGSSGSPLLSHSASEVVGIHHSGGDLVEPGTGLRYFRNAGTTMRAILEDLRDTRSDIYDRVTRKFDR